MPSVDPDFAAFIAAERRAKVAEPPPTARPGPIDVRISDADARRIGYYVAWGIFKMLLALGLILVGLNFLLSILVHR